ncbi:MAG: ferrochelatase [Nocardioidaceae bacterium]|nr:ferrochelatase [Nocardioidaceae bacterium]
MSASRSAGKSAPSVAPYDALLLVSFGGPEGHEDVLPFLENVTRGRGVPPDRLAEVATHYQAFGGRSPINDQCRALAAAVRDDLAAAGLPLPVYWGNRNWGPYLQDTVATMAADGVQRAACFLTSAYSSYSGCRQYREDLFAAVAGLPGVPQLDRLRHYFNHPGFVAPFTDATARALATLLPEHQDEAHLLFVTHSIPAAMNEASGGLTGGGGAYVRQHHDVAATVAAAVASATGRARGHDLVFCSRSGPPRVPWLEPDVNDRLRQLHASGTPAAVLVPVGFVSDHMEVIFDLDTEAATTAQELGMGFARAATPGVDARFVAMVRDLLLERSAVERGETAIDRAVTGTLPASWDRCPPDCCRNPRDPCRSALCGVDAPAVGASPMP